jgi:hypothetical protein
MSKHTPGPWAAEEAGRSGYWISTKGHPFTIVDSIDDECRHGAINGDNAGANARLIAAAPELLEALKLLDEAFCADDYGTKEGRAKGRAALVATRAAIAKAEGKQ